MTTEAAISENDGWEWAIVEIMGHRKHAGRVREEERFGVKMLRVDIPNEGDPEKGWTTHYYGGASIFSYTLTDEASVMRANKPWQPYRYQIEDQSAEDGDDHGED